MHTIRSASPRRVSGALFFGGLVALAVPVFSGAACAPADTLDGGGERTASPDQEALNSIPRYSHKSVCNDAQPGYRRCHARIRTEDDGDTVKNFASPSGLTPAQLKAAYNITGTNTGIVAIVDAQDNPNAEKDLAVYRSQFGLPPCTTANGCFKKVNQSGQASPLPAGDTGWGGEIALDLDMVSAGCPSCKILLVEANSASNDDLGIAVNTAASMGAAAISNSYGGNEDSSNSTYDSKYYNHPGILITVSAGDSGYGAQYPASGFYVLAVGGTSLTQSSSSRGWAESAWTGTGSGCSAYTTKPSFQKDASCAKRTVGDVSAVADPNTGVAVYDTYGSSGWQVYGGTSASSPLVAAIMVASGKAGQPNSWPYSNTGDFYDVTSGSNGSCTSKYLCTAGAAYDGPTGWGTPNGGAIAAGSGSSSSSSSSTSTSTSSSSSSTSSSSGKTSSSSSSTSSTSSSSTSSSSGGGTCSHNECTSGTRLTSGCDPCVTKICAADSYCCSTQWDSVCVGEASSICGETCGGGGGGGGTCSHLLCTTGVKLTSGCNSCASAVCAQDSYCCNNQWDNVCVKEVSSICGLSCPGN